MVDPATADVSFASGDTIEVDGGETAGEPIASFLRTIDVAPGEGSTGVLGVKTGDWRRYSETRLEDGEEVHVYGPIERNPSISTRGSDFNAAVRDATGAKRFLVSDTDESATIRRLLNSGMKAIAGALFLLLGVAGLFATLLSIVI